MRKPRASGVCQLRQAVENSESKGVRILYEACSLKDAKFWLVAGPETLRQPRTRRAVARVYPRSVCGVIRMDR